jgi:hypothetical protein
MVLRVAPFLRAARAAVLLISIAALGGCGAGTDPGVRATLAADASTPTTPASCAATVLATLRRVALHAYREGIASERTGVAMRLIETSAPLRAALERDDAAAARSAARALVATGKLTTLRVIDSQGRTLADAGTPRAVAPLHGTVIAPGGRRIGSYIASVWADGGLVDEIDGLAEASTTLRAGGHTLAGSSGLPPVALPSHGALTSRGVDYVYTSFPAERYPSGSLRVYVVRSLRSTGPLCGRTEQDTVVNTLSRIARLIYQGEAGRRTLPQVRRVQHNEPLLRAVAAGDPAATRRAIVALLNQHIVRLRVSSGGRLLSDVGGPYVLAPVRAPLRLAGRPIGSFVLSIQDDEGYLRLTHRLAGLDVLMHAGGQIVMNSVGPSPGLVPASGTYRYRGNSFRVFTFTAQAFPSGPLRIQVLIPIPYS